MTTFWEIAAHLVGLFCLFVILVIFHFGFESRTCPLIVPVPVHCFFITLSNPKLYSWLVFIWLMDLMQFLVIVIQFLCSVIPVSIKNRAWSDATECLSWVYTVYLCPSYTKYWTYQNEISIDIVWTFFSIYFFKCDSCFINWKYTIITIMILSFCTDRSGQTVQTQIGLLLEEQSDQGLHCLLFHLHHYDTITLRFGLFVWILGKLHVQQKFLTSQNLGPLL